MTNKIIYSTFFILLFHIHINAQTTWHVATTGSDNSGNGTETNPYATLKKAANQVQAGDTVYLHEGTYRNSDFNDNDIWEGDNLVTIIANGTATNYIKFMPFPGDNVLLEFDSALGVLIKNSSYIIFSGFEVKGISDQITQTEADNAWGLYKDSNGTIHDLAVEMGIDINDPSIAGITITKPTTSNIDKPKYYNGRGIVANSSHHIIITNNTVRDVPSSAIRSQQSDYVTISNNTVFNNTYWTTQGVGAITVAEATVIPANDTFTGDKIKLINNYVHHNENRLISWNPTKTFVKMVIDEGTGLFLTRNNDTYTHGYILIANNISAFNGASGIVCHKTDRAKIEHNTCYKNGTTNDSAAGGIGVNDADDVSIKNNISYAEPDHWALGKLGGTLSNIVISNNILYNENGTETIHKNMSNGWVETNPLLANPENNDFTLNANSPAIDAGSTTSISTDDIDGNPRDDGFPDIGAYEYSEALGVDDNQKFSIKIYPNPTSDYIYIRSDVTDLNKIKVYDQTGRIVMSKRINNNNDLIVLDLSNISKGLYFIKTSRFLKTIIKK